MRIDELRVEAFKNLRNIRVHFDRESPYTVLVGENGSGKSNLLEALALIFRSLDLDEEAPFSYELKYRCRNHDVAVQAKENRYAKFRAKPTSGGAYEALSRRKYMSVDEDDRPVYRPTFRFRVLLRPGRPTRVDFRKAPGALLRRDHQAPDRTIY